MHMDNTNLSPGNFFYDRGLNRDPSAQWPGSSETDYLRWSSLLIAGRTQGQGRRCDQFDEIRGETYSWARTRRTAEGAAFGKRDEDDDGDGSPDEDFLNGKDDDGDGRVDEDFAAVSPDMLSTEMIDYTPEALEDEVGEQHVPLGLRIRRTSHAWSTPGKRDFIGIHYQITNLSRELDGVGHSIDSVFMGFYWRPMAGRRSNSGSGIDSRIGRADWSAGPRDLPVAIPEIPPRPSLEDSTLRIFWNCSFLGEGGASPGAGAMLLLSATRFPRLGFKKNLSPDDIARDDEGNAPRHLATRSYRIFRPGIAYAQGGAPLNDQERYDALSNPAASQRFPANGLFNGTPRLLISVGPYVALPSDSSIEFDLAFAVGNAYFGPGPDFPSAPGDAQEFDLRLGRSAGRSSLLASCDAAWRTWRGDDVVDRSPLLDGFNCLPAEADPENGMGGRETCILAPAGEAGHGYSDCHDLGGAGTSRLLDESRCTWFDLDCDPSSGACVGGFPAVFRRRWVGTSPPLPPRTRLVSRDHAIEVQWDDISENSADPSSRRVDFKGYRLYRAAGWNRDPSTGVAGPANDLWELLGDWSLGSAAAPATARRLEELRDRENFPDSICPSSGEACIPNPAAADSTQSCDGQRADGRPCRVHRVGWYHYLDRQVHNGFRYFYSVTAYDQTDKYPGEAAGPLDRYESQETGRSATEDQAAVSRTECFPGLDRVKVVPNPYRFRASWDLRASPPDPTGTHVDFNHLPCGPFTLRIFTAAGDLLRTFHESDVRGGGGTVEWDLVTRNGQDVRAGVMVYSIDSARFGHRIGRFTLIR